MRRAVVAALALTALQAGTPARADEAGRLRTARTIIEVTHAADRVRQIMPVLMKQMRPMLLQSGGNAQEVDDFIAEGLKRMGAQTDGFADLAAQIYAREFSDEDLNALLAFYRTPAGQHLLEKQVVITQGMIAMGQQWGQTVAKQVLDDFAKRKAQPPKL